MSRRPRSPLAVGKVAIRSIPPGQPAPRRDASPGQRVGVVGAVPLELPGLAILHNLTPLVVALPAVLAGLWPFLLLGELALEAGWDVVPVAALLVAAHRVHRQIRQLLVHDDLAALRLEQILGLVLLPEARARGVSDLFLEHLKQLDLHVPAGLALVGLPEVLHVVDGLGFVQQEVLVGLGLRGDRVAEEAAAPQPADAALIAAPLLASAAVADWVGAPDELDLALFVELGARGWRVGISGFCWAMVSAARGNYF
ncbi:hypothetical protein B0J12DRAFT_669089 [Macrophomina phaseolina]|uniref:N-acetyltransferase domain-containing protein n=1 Tax=Macrophomina phaseolina TaxID=35725 RepID=A0ABQ8G8N0_9PEZI|nr:hypothetical protein B0J12DRAFT_669089 [Macrophomina phaseolina]